MFILAPGVATERFAQNSTNTTSLGCSRGKRKRRRKHTVERSPAKHMYGILWYPIKGMKSDAMPYSGFMLQGMSEIAAYVCATAGSSRR